MAKLKLLLFINLVLHFHSLLASEFDQPHLRTTPLNDLTIQPDKTTFKIALFADLHFGEDAWTDWGPLQDVNSLKAMSTLLDNETPGEFSLLSPLLLYL